MISHDTPLQTFSVDTVTLPAAAEPAEPAIDAPQAGTAVVEPMASQADETASSGGGFISLAGGIIIVLVAVGLAYLWQHLQQLVKDTAALRQSLDRLSSERLSEQNAADGLRQDVATLRQEIDALQRQVERLEARPVSPVEPMPSTDQTRLVSPAAEEFPAKRAAPTAPSVKYASLQAPDAKGVLRFAERTMSDTPSEQKMFELLLDHEAGTGTYRVNMSATRLILQDLLMFKDFVKPFTFSGDAARAKIENVADGHIVRQDGFWVVERLLEVNIS